MSARIQLAKEMLRGRTIVDVVDAGDGYVALWLENDQKPTLLVSASSDPEGNGPGTLVVSLATGEHRCQIGGR